MKKLLLLLLTAFSLAVSTDAQTSTDGLMTATPVGTLKTYERGGYSYYTNNGYVRRGAQTGDMDVVFASDGRTVYIKDPLSKALTGVWVKGSLSSDGSTITLPLGQPIAYDLTQKDSVVLAVMDYDDEYEEFSQNTSVKSLTYTIKNDVITLNGTSTYVIFAAMWQKSKNWAEYGDYSSKYTLKTKDDEPVTVPSDLKADTLKLKGHTYVTNADVAYNVLMGQKGNDVYLKGLFTATPDAWIKGMRNGNKLTFPYGQYLAPTHSGTTNYYMIATDHAETSKIEDLVLNYDEATGNYTTGQYVVLNTAKNVVYLVEALDNVVISKEMHEGAYNVPYEENFSGGLSDFTVIDANADGITWRPNTMSMTAEYNWSTTHSADDWLVSPKIALKADTSYVFTVKARSMAGQLERMEVKMGSAAVVDSLTQTVLPVFDVKTEDFTDFQATVTVKKDGVYCFGLHALTDANGNGLYVKSVRVEKGVASGINTITAPTSVTDKVYSIDGRLVRKGTTSLEGLAKGMYIVNGTKIVVR